MNTGLDLERELKEQSAEDHIFGAEALSGLAEKIDYKKYLPVGELQNIGEDKMDCATRSPLNILEAKFNYLLRNHIISQENREWLGENGYYTGCGARYEIEFADAFIAIKSHTTRQGNSLKAPCQAIHEFGLVPKSLLPQVPNFDDYHNPNRITPEIDDLGQEFLKRFSINYDRVFQDKYKGFIQKIMLNTGGHAWGQIKNGIYQKTDNPFNHAFAIFPPTQYEAFDNYIDSVDGDFVKRLASDYKLLPYSYRMIVNEKKKTKLSLMKKLCNWLHR